MEPEITVITATYNRAYILSVAIQSVLDQTFDNWEYIIVDDGSEDDTYDVVSTFQKKNSRIKYLKLEKNSGQSIALNKGIEAAKGALISFLDSDDALHPEYLEQQVEAFKQNDNLGLCYVGADYYFNDEKIRTLHIHQSGDLEYYLFKRLTGINGSTFTVRATVFKDVGGFDPEFPALKDFELITRIARYYDFDYLTGYNTRVQLSSKDRISDNVKLVTRGRIMFHKKHKERGKEIGAYHLMLKKMARIYAQNSKDMPKAYKCLFDAIKYKPDYLYAYVYLFKLPFLFFKNV